MHPKTKHRPAVNRAATFKTKQPYPTNNPINFNAINKAAMRVLPNLLKRWLPNGKIVGREWTSINPRRADRNIGSFKVNMDTGKWADFASGDCGGDIVSLAAYLAGLKQGAAARQLETMLGVRNG